MPCPARKCDWINGDRINGCYSPTLRILGMSWAVKITCFEALFGVSLVGSGVSIGGVRILRVLINGGILGI